MAIVKLRGPLKERAGGQPEHEIEAATVRAALSELERRRPALAGWILDERGTIRRHINVFVNGDQAGADAPVESGDRVDVLPAISGG